MLRAGTVRKKGLCPPFFETSTSALKRFMNKDNTVGHVFAFPFIFGFVCFSLIPVCISFYYAFTNYSLGSKTAAFIGFKNFLRLFQDEVFLKSLAITLKYVLISVPLKLTFALLVAYLLTRPSRMVTFYRSLYYLPSLVGGSVAVALVWKQLFARKGLFNSVLANMDMSTINWFGNQKLALYPLILMSVWQFGSSMIIFAAGLKEIPVSYYEAARIDGARGYQSFFRITLPCLSPIILYNLIMQTISAFMAFTQAAPTTAPCCTPCTFTTRPSSTMIWVTPAPCPGLCWWLWALSRSSSSKHPSSGCSAKQTKQGRRVRLCITEKQSPKCCITFLSSCSAL